MGENSKPYLSISQLDMLSRCGEQYRRRYIEHEIIPPGIALIVGSATDRAVSCDLEHKIKTGDLLPWEELAEIARDEVAAALDGGEVMLTAEEAIAGLKAVKGQAIDKAVRFSGLHHARLAPKLEPTHVQRRWRVELNNFPRDLVGVIDVQEGTKAVRDTKTSGKSPAQDAAHTSDQLTMYALACHVIDGRIPEVLALDYLVDTQIPKPVTLETIRTVESFNPLLARIEKANEAIEKQVFMPARQTDWWCHPRWCGFAATCRYYRQIKSVSVAA